MIINGAGGRCVFSAKHGSNPQEQTRFNHVWLTLHTHIYNQQSREDITSCMCAWFLKADIFTFDYKCAWVCLSVCIRLSLCVCVSVRWPWVQCAGVLLICNLCFFRISVERRLKCSENHHFSWRNRTSTSHITLSNTRSPNLFQIMEISHFLVSQLLLVAWLHTPAKKNISTNISGSLKILFFYMIAMHICFYLLIFLSGKPCEWVTSQYIIS